MATATALEFAEVQVVPALAVQLDLECGPDPASIGAAIRAGFESLMSCVNRRSLRINGEPRSIYTGYGPGGVSITLAIPVETALARSVIEAPVRVDMIPGARAYRFTHHGPYPELSQTYHRITAFMTEKGWMQSEADWARYMPMWEEYISDPERTPAAELVTYIYLPAA